jgi:hypothetical protein
MSYDGLSSRLVPESLMDEFLVSCFGICPTYECWVVTGHFAMGFDVDVDGRLAARLDRPAFAKRFAAHFDANVLYGDKEPDLLWTLFLPDGSHLLATLAEEDAADEHYLIGSATAPVPGVPEAHVDPSLWQRLL